jgi:acyl carrier protein
MNDPARPDTATQPAHDAPAVLAYLESLWESIFRVPHVAPEDDFFSLGGDSASVIEMLVAVSAHFDREFNYNGFFPKPNIGTLGALIVEDFKAHHDQLCR